MQLVVDPYSFHINYAGEYTSTMRITQLNQQDQDIYSAVFEDVFPKTLSMLDLNQSSQNSVQKLNVTFVYRRWYADHPSLNKIAAPITPNKLNPLAPVTPPVVDVQENNADLYTIPFVNQPYDKSTVRPSNPLVISNAPLTPPVRTGVFGVGNETAVQPWNPPVINY
jgi:hypothetical protein